MKKQNNVRLATLTAMFAALIIVTTAVIKIPAPLGYVHVGDAVIYLSACVLPGPFGFFAAGIGGALADLLAGYPQWALPTAIIKVLNVLPFFLIKYAFKNSSRRDKIINLPNLIMLVPTALVTLGGYFVANMLMYDTGAAIAELLPNLFQAAASSVVFAVLGFGLDAVGFNTDKLLSVKKTG